MSGDSGSSSGQPQTISIASDATSVALDEAKRTIDRQAEMFDDIQGKAINLMKYTVTLASLLATGVTLLEKSAALDSFAALVNGYTVSSIGLLGLAAVVSGFAYTLSTQINGIGPDGVRDAARAETPEYKERLVRGYADWIEQNRELNERADACVSLAILLVTGAVIALGTGLVNVFVVDLPLWAAGVDVVVFLALAYVSGVIHRLVSLAVNYDGGTLNPVLGGRKNGALPHSTSRTRERLDTLRGDD
ncbi:hypothetical protein [Halocalculus aciditolerans]|uniref:Uncharacterized protein n=1 Tax=Halocalculus aciditolerans TaxID=1383812 RepID=A0A830EZZ9_9EURY|nr:hypothetical protein [Halocalculus aciditolerans]GGL47387.1 hypothetical protein GCM10009039_02080 [Halocalculus aciditolerans]